MPSLREFLDDGTPVEACNDLGQSLLGIAAMRGDRRAAALLLDRGADPNRVAWDGYPPLHLAVILNHVATARLLVKCGADVNRAGPRGLMPLLLASQIGSADLIRLLLERGADPNARTCNGSTALQFAIDSGNPTAVEAIISQGAAVRDSHQTQKHPPRRRQSFSAAPDLIPRMEYPVRRESVPSGTGLSAST